MTCDPRRHHRRSIRLKGYDYTQAGAYFVTITAHQRLCLFGAVVDGEMRLNECGGGVVRWWADIPQHFETVDIDAFVVMPSHIHGIIVITDPNVGAGSPRPGPHGAMGAGTAPLRRPALGNVIAYFKYQSAKHVNALRQTPGAPVWQRNYYEHVIRTDASLTRIRRHILDNPAGWAFDRENPDVNQLIM